MKVTVASIVVGALGTISKGWVKRLEDLEIRGQVKMLYFDLRPGQTCHSKVMHRKEVNHSDGSYEKNRVGGLG